MNLTVLAASGRTGNALTRQALERGHTVTAIARDPGRIDLDHPNLRKVAGDVSDPASIAAVVDADSVVLSGLGTDARGLFSTAPRRSSPPGRGASSGSAPTARVRPPTLRVRAPACSGR
ncbi:NAD(P)-dependent oxidoreductase [Lentzea indica]|uniref:NAD(P)-dependent oxidoreductase n=1 Tax=Lentzea indica TaxID=2604800 RepID=UPI001FE33A73|nr:NAD(P)H-binding protein [Lentzea indica]